jgi:hypothetical protein
MTSLADACSYCMGSVVSISSRIYLYSSYFGSHRRQKTWVACVMWCLIKGNKSHSTVQRKKETTQNISLHFDQIFVCVVGKPFAPNDDDSKGSLILFQILVLLDTISDWPRRVSWQHFYTQSLPTSNTGNTACLPCRHATPYKYSFTILFVASTFKRTGAWGKSQSRQIFVFDLNLMP